VMAGLSEEFDEKVRRSVHDLGFLLTKMRLLSGSPLRNGDSLRCDCRTEKIWDTRRTWFWNDPLEASPRVARTIRT